MSDITLDPAKGQTLEAWAKAIPADAGIVRLASGYHERPTFTGRRPQTIQVVGYPGAVIGGAAFRDTAKWLFRRCFFAAQGLIGPGNFQALIDTDTLSSDITFGSTSMAYGCEFKACEDIGALSVADKLALHHTLVRLRGRNMVVAFSRLHDCRNAVQLAGPDCRVEDSIIERFTVDGVDLGASGQRVLRNTFRDGRHFAEELLHADACQLQNSSARDIIVKDNRIEASPLADYLQGITGFDGRWADVVVKDNVVVTSAYHGITMFGVDGVTIEGNEVIQERDNGVVPWIQVTRSKDGRPSTGVECHGNTAPKMLIDKPATMSANTIA